jgi:hypothetical protein
MGELCDYWIQTLWIKSYDKNGQKNFMPHVQKCFWPPDLRYLKLIFWDKTWFMSSLGQNLDPFFSLVVKLTGVVLTVESSKGPAWILSYWEDSQSWNLAERNLDS